MPKKNSSLSEEEIVCGVKIKKMPCGRYFKAIQSLKNMPEHFFKEMFDGKEVQLSEYMSVSGIIELIIKFISVFPDFSLKFLSELLDIDEKILNDKITPNELVQIIKAFIRINELESFFMEMKSMISKITARKLETKIGFKEQSQSASR